MENDSVEGKNSSTQEVENSRRLAAASRSAILEFLSSESVSSPLNDRRFTLSATTLTIICEPVHQKHGPEDL